MTHIEGNRLIRPFKVGRQAKSKSPVHTWKNEMTITIKNIWSYLGAICHFTLLTFHRGCLAMTPFQTHCLLLRLILEKSMLLMKID